MSEFVFQIAVIFLPGLLWAKISSVYASRRVPTQFQFLLSALNFGLLSYLIVFIAYKLGSIDFTYPVLEDDSSTEWFSAFADEIIWALCASLVGSIVWCYVVNYRLFMRFLLKIGASKAFGDEDVWEFSFNSSDEASKFINLRDYRNGYVYSGYVYAWSGADRLRELVLLDVKVYNLSGKELYVMPRMYISREMSDLTIEFPTET